ncbi:hypothetical protein JXM67_02265 [candidate division WOR-3 bacterium]|nr:hypothetical protein [candidate division WOR-3 bacterium]
MTDEKKPEIRFQRYEPKGQLTGDLLGFELYLHDFIKDLKTTKPPFVIGLTGEWGIGKTTFMRFVKEELEKPTNKDFQLVGPVELWKYSGNMDLSATLVSTISNFFEKSKKNPEERKTFKALGRKTLKTLLTLVSGSSVGIPGGATIKIDAEKIFSIWKGAEKELHKQFDDLVKKGLEGETSKLIVLVDDLDRCLPDQALAFLEKLRLFFDSRVIFIVALDEDVVADAIKSKFGSDVKIDGHWYLEKLIDRFYSLPVPTPDQFSNFLNQTFKNFFETDNSVFEKLRNIWSSIKRDNPHLWGRKAMWNPRRLQMAVDQITTIFYANRRGGEFKEAAVCLFPLFLLRQSYGELYRAAKNEPFIIRDIALLPGPLAIFPRGYVQKRTKQDEIITKYGQTIGRFTDEPSTIGLCRAVIIATEITKNYFYSDKSKPVVTCLKEYIENFDRYE